jgi:hypothetical protein
VVIISFVVCSSSRQLVSGGNLPNHYGVDDWKTSWIVLMTPFNFFVFIRAYFFKQTRPTKKPGYLSAGHHSE